jgi:hypothetical protein
MLPQRVRFRSLYVVTACACLAAASPAAAQQQDAQLWTQVNTNVPLTDELRVTLEQIARLSDRQDGLYQTEFGALLGLKVTKQLELGFGYRKVGAHNGNTGANEDRIRQQVVGTFGPVVTRFRVDESFYLPNSTGWGQRSGYERMRNIVGVVVPIGKRISMDVGYLNQFRPGRTNARAQMDHALTMQLTINLRGFAFPNVND